MIWLSGWNGTDNLKRIFYLPSFLQTFTSLPTPLVRGRWGTKNYHDFTEENVTLLWYNSIKLLPGHIAYMAAFNLAKTIEYWLDSAAYDLDTGSSLLEAKRFPYALFFAHLALEKILKAIFVKASEEHAPHTHSLIFLASKAKVEIPESILDRLAEYTEFHVEARYPDEKKDFYQKCTEEFTRQKFAEMVEVYQWLIQKLEK